MISVNLIEQDDELAVLCKRCRSYFGPSRHCEVGCLGCAVLYVQKRAKEGESADKAFEEWLNKNIPHKDGEEIIADLMGVDNLDTVRDILRENHD
jgi:hypothetical protein